MYLFLTYYQIVVFPEIPTTFVTLQWPHTSIYLQSDEVKRARQMNQAFAAR